jgi:hypothetical protein
MKVKIYNSVLIIFIAQIAIGLSCLRKTTTKNYARLTHGAGPQSNWDWVIIAIITAYNGFNFYLLNKIPDQSPVRKMMTNHIKQSILSN